ncbi:hypothetical protein [Kineococcus auxinigenes]|uniref:hypothetical protein n=1 Tax=unclassified Kineococcus TaxID=2621656 RepID=UPI003D7C4AF2
MVQHGAVTPPRVLHAEWTRLASLTSTSWVVIGTVVAASSLAFGLGLFVGPGDAVTGTSLAASGSLLAQLGVLVLGVLVGTGDFATGTSLATYAAVPRRLPVLVAQIVVVAAVALVTAVVALAASVLVTTPARTGSGVSWELADPATLRAAAGYVLFLMGAAVCGVGLGALLRRPPAALTTGVLLFVVVDQVLAANPGRVTDTVRALLPGSGTRLFADDAQLAASAAGGGPDLGAWGGGLVLSVWCVVLVLLAGYRLARHDIT